MKLLHRYLFRIPINHSLWYFINLLMRKLSSRIRVSVIRLVGRILLHAQWNVNYARELTTGDETSHVSPAWLIRALSDIFTSSTTLLVVHIIVLFPFCRVLRDFTPWGIWQASLRGQCYDISRFRLIKILSFLREKEFFTHFRSSFSVNVECYFCSIYLASR